jgi:hypothetical protein
MYEDKFLLINVKFKWLQLDIVMMPTLVPTVWITSIAGDAFSPLSVFLIFMIYHVQPYYLAGWNILWTHWSQDANTMGQGDSRGISQEDWKASCK